LLVVDHQSYRDMSLRITSFVLLMRLDIIPSPPRHISLMKPVDLQLQTIKKTSTRNDIFNMCKMLVNSRVNVREDKCTQSTSEINGRSILWAIVRQQSIISSRDGQEILEIKVKDGIIVTRVDAKNLEKVLCSSGSISVMFC
jgi:hypothetical protein